MATQAEFGKSRVVVGTTTERPMILPIALLNREVVDAGNASPHKSMLVELPVFVAIGTEPMPRVVMPLVGKSDGDTIAVKCPKFFDETIIEFLVPFAGEESNNGFAAREEFRAVAPDAIVGVGERDTFRVAGIPGVLGHADFLGCGLGVEWREWWSWVFSCAHIGKRCA